MITVTEQTQRTLETPEEIGAYLAARYADHAAKARFQPGERVSFRSSAGVPPELAIGGVGIMVYDAPGNPFSHVMVLHSSGREIVVQVPSDNLAQAEVAGE
ncbi:hypothetical protein [Methylobacterium dankookense]|uniref:Uncharacterized protein n=1 Tax=Methylobacterium dankookense TaxID=560405 RepID=A0A564G578_9HYPH|nr:hypothetical protein [Methylobacterium dankookense]GJD58157.1 hypothetical protein IFDJLNFL_4072 [Methylobacterium dankookense]VUF15108.1 hypothetical protein MTDSW087_04841 [Methylobacterium dankookense]